MTLIVYKDGYLAADTGATRNDSREYFNKIFHRSTKHHDYWVAYAGTIDAIYSHWAFLNDPDSTEVPVCNSEGIIVRTEHTTGEVEVFTFCNFEHATGRGVWIPEDTNHLVVQGADSAVSMALAINHVRPEFTAAQIIASVSEVNTACDTRFGVRSVCIKTGSALTAPAGMVLRGVL